MVKDFFLAEVLSEAVRKNLSWSDKIDRQMVFKGIERVKIV